MATGVFVVSISMTLANCPTSKTPCLVQHSQLYLLYWRSSSQCWVKITKFSLPWQPGSVWCKFQWHQRIAQPRKPPIWCNIPNSISCIGQVLANFKSNFRNFRCHGNRGRSGVNFNDTSKLPDLKNPLFGATFMALCHIGWVMANFVSKFPNFRYRGNRGCLMYISTTQLNCLTLKTPGLVQHS